MAIDPQSTGLTEPQLISADNLDQGRRRLTYKLTDGRTRSVIVAQADDNNDLRKRIGDAFEQDTRRLIRNNETIEG